MLKLVRPWQIRSIISKICDDCGEMVVILRTDQHEFWAHHGEDLVMINKLDDAIPIDGYEVDGSQILIKNLFDVAHNYYACPPEHDWGIREG